METNMHRFPIAYLVYLKENYENRKIILKNIECVLKCLAFWANGIARIGLNTGTSMFGQKEHNFCLVQKMSLILYCQKYSVSTIVH